MRVILQQIYRRFFSRGSRDQMPSRVIKSPFKRPQPSVRADTAHTRTHTCVCSPDAADNESIT